MARRQGSQAAIEFRAVENGMGKEIVKLIQEQDELGFRDIQLREQLLQHVGAELVFAGDLVGVRQRLKRVVGLGLNLGFQGR